MGYRPLVGPWVSSSLCNLFFFSRDEATLYEGVSVGPSVGRLDGWMVTSYFFGLLGATFAVYTALYN